MPSGNVYFPNPIYLRILHLEIILSNCVISPICLAREKNKVFIVALEAIYKKKNRFTNTYEILIYDSLEKEMLQTLLQK